MKDYKTYELDKKEAFLCLAEGMGLNAVIAALFYNSWIAMLPGLGLVVLYFKEKKRKLARRRKRRMREDLKEFLNALIAALQTGRSVENAFAEGRKDLERYREQGAFLDEIKMICAATAVGEPLEKLLNDFAGRADLEELQYFSEVFSVAKRSGGNIVAIMKNTIRMLQEKLEVQEEISAQIAEKEFEFSIMSVIPLAMILYLRLGASNLAARLYGNLSGIVIMTICLLVYGGCYLYGKRLLEIGD